MLSLAPARVDKLICAIAGAQRGRVSHDQLIEAGVDRRPCTATVLCLAARITLNHQLGRPSRALSTTSPKRVESVI